MDHTYEEIRNVVIDILAGREKVRYQPNQYQPFSPELQNCSNGERQKPLPRRA